MFIISFGEKSKAINESFFEIITFFSKPSVSGVKLKNGKKIKSNIVKINYSKYTDHLKKIDNIYFNNSIIFNIKSSLFRVSSCE